jgi:AcrR family transcriptional regulator
MMKTGAPVMRGRPRTFDRDQAVAAAMDLFLAKGYDGVSLEDLQKAMGNISPPSFYAAFGSKDALFREVVALYRESMGQSVVKALEASPVRDAVEGMMRAGVDLFLSNPSAPGCLLILGAVHSTRTSKDAHDLLCEARSEGCEMLRTRLVRAVDEGELPKGLPIGDIAGFYATFMQGMAVRARDGATRAEMLAWVRTAMAAWPALTKPPKKTARASRRR